MIRLIFGAVLGVAVLLVAVACEGCGGDMGAGIYQNYEPAGGVDVDVPGVVMGE